MLVAGHTLLPHTGTEQAYNSFDAALTLEIFDKIVADNFIDTEARLITPGRNAQPNIIYNFERALQAPVLEMMLRGWRIDPLAREDGTTKLERDVAKLDNILLQVAFAVWDKELNPNSTKQLKEFFYERLGITPITVSVKGEVKTPMDADVLEKLGDHFELRLIVNTILKRREVAKQLKVLQTEIDPDWRMRTSYNIGGTKEGRFSSSKSPEGTGSNIQNIEEELRRMFIADDGYKIACLDLEQADSRFIGWYCGVLFNDWSYLDACESGDLHTTVARMTFSDLPWTGDMKKDREIAERKIHWDTVRQSCKKLGHATNFFGKVYTMSRETGVPQRNVAQFVDKYFTAFPCISRLHQWCASELQTKMRLTNCFGRERDFFDRPEAEETLRKGLAFLAASATADCLNLGMWRTWKHLGRVVQLLAQLHDAQYFQFKDDAQHERGIIQRAAELMKVELVAPNGRRFSIPVDAKTGWNWAPRWKTDEKGKRLEANPKGLDKVGAQRT